MVNFLNLLEDPQFRHERIFEVMRDFRKGGINPAMYDEFIKAVNELPDLYRRKPIDYYVFKKFDLKDISKDDVEKIFTETARRSIEESKTCWHPNANNITCNVEKSGKIKISAAHSIQNNGILSRIVENGHVITYSPRENKLIGKNHASIFWGFCNTHDAIFQPIEITSYIQTIEQNFLFAYRGFVVTSHKKMEVSKFMNFGEQSENDIIENKNIFNYAILQSDFSVIETEVFEIPEFYPIACSSCFYLEFDFEGKQIRHSENRMEFIFVTLFPTDDKTYFLLSYFTQDKSLYGNLGKQLRNRNNLKSDITMLIAAHIENVYFQPKYYRKFIQKYEKTLLKLISAESQRDIGLIGENGNIESSISLTPKDYLNNRYKIEFFCS